MGSRPEANPEVGVASFAPLRVRFAPTRAYPTCSLKFERDVRTVGVARFPERLNVIDED